MRIAVTGSSGYVGHNLVPWLRACGYEVTEYDPVVGNQMLDLIYDSCPDAVVHLAAQSKVADAGHVQSLIRTNIDDLAALVDGLVGFVGRFVFFSSSAIYALPEAGLYGYSKAIGEAIVKERLPFTSVIRPFNIVGGVDTLKNDHLVPKLAHAARTGRPFEVYGTGEERRRYVHMETVCRLVEHMVNGAVAHFGPGDVQVWDAIGDEALTVMQVVALAQEVLGPFAVTPVGSRRDNPAAIEPPCAIDQLLTGIGRTCDNTRDVLKRALLEQREAGT